MATPAAGKLASVIATSDSHSKLRSAAVALAACLPCFAIDAAAAIVWDQSTVLESPIGANTSMFIPVNNFTLDEPAALTDFSVWLSDAFPIGVVIVGDGVADGVFRNFSGTLSYYFFEDEADVPGNLIASGTAQELTVTDTGIDVESGDEQEDVFRVDGQFMGPLDLAAGDYWFGVREGVVGTPTDGSDIVWRVTTVTMGPFAALFLDGQNIDDLNFAPGADNAFLLQAASVPEPVALALMLTGLGALGVLRHRPRAQS